MSGVAPISYLPGSGAFERGHEQHSSAFQCPDGVRHTSLDQDTLTFADRLPVTRAVRLTNFDGELSSHDEEQFIAAIVNLPVVGRDRQFELREAD